MIKKAVRDAYNKHQEAEYMAALSVYNRVCAAGKGRRNFDFRAAERKLSYENTDRYLLPWLKFNASEKPLKPKKKDFSKATSTSTLYSYDEIVIGFDNKTRCIEWRVSENNRAVERAHGHPVSKAFFSELNRVNWTSKTGGVFVGNDEYNREDYSAGGGGNYITKYYGGIGKREAGFSSKRSLFSGY